MMFDAIFRVHDYCVGDTMRCMICVYNSDIEDDAEVSDDVDVSGDEEEEDESNVSGLLDDEVRGISIELANSMLHAATTSGKILAK
jgi:hypothetical protein